MQGIKKDWDLQNEINRLRSGGGGYSGGSENELLCGRIATAGLYKDRALNDEEVLSNFNADKARFGYE
jgi:hypothetical protein